MDTTSAEPPYSPYLSRQAINDEINSLEESARALKSRSNALAPISRLPPEILAAVFSFLPPSARNNEADHLEWISVTHVCRRWREIALNHHRFWSHINFTELTPDGAAEILARAKTAPLHLEANFSRWMSPQTDDFERQLEAHISHTRHLRIVGPLRTVLRRLVSSAPILETLSLSHQFGYNPFEAPHSALPVNLFNCTAPSLTTLELENYNICWKSSLLKGLRDLKIIDLSTKARLILEDWLDALNEMPQLERLVLRSATSFAPQAAPPISGPSRRVTLPFLTRFDITASAKDCALALAHLMLPALTQLGVCPECLDREGEDVRPVIPFVSRIVHGLHGTEPLRSIQISGERTRAEVVAWTTPDAEVKVCDPDTPFSASVSARLTFSATGYDWRHGVDTMVLDALLVLLPMDSVSTLTTNNTRLNKEFWICQAPRWPLLERASLVPTAVKAFMDMLVEDAPPDGPRLPSLTNLTLVDVTLLAPRIYRLGDMLIERVEQGVPLDVLDLRTCIMSDFAIQLLREIVVEVLVGRIGMEQPTLDWHGGYWKEVEYDDDPCYSDTDEVDDEEGYEDMMLDMMYDYDYDYDTVDYDDYPF